LVAILVVSGTHGFVVAALATALGDAGPSHAGRRTLNPFAHLDLVGGVCLLLFGLGWARPVQVAPEELRAPRRDLALTAVASLAAVAVVGVVTFLLRPLAVASLPPGPAVAAAATLQTTATLALGFSLFNALPVPPLTGRYLLVALLPKGAAEVVDRYASHAGVALAVLIVTGLLPRFLLPSLRSLTTWVLGRL